MKYYICLQNLFITSFKRYKSLYINVVLIPICYCASGIESFQVSNINTENTPVMEYNERDSIVLCWDTPPEEADSISSYEVFYHTKDDQQYTLLKSFSTSANPKLVIRRIDLPIKDTIFYFHIRSVLKSGFISDFHNSSDTNALPQGGWYLLWR
jgi:hypothetical protein